MLCRRQLAMKSLNRKHVSPPSATAETPALAIEPFQEGQKRQQKIREEEERKQKAAEAEQQQKIREEEERKQKAAEADRQQKIREEEERTAASEKLLHAPAPENIMLALAVLPATAAQEEAAAAQKKVLCSVWPSPTPAMFTCEL